MASFYRNHSGQVTFEQLLITGVFLLLLVTIFVYTNTSYTENSRDQKASEAVNAIVTAANRIYETGPNTKTFIYVTFPDGVTSANLTNNEVTLSLKT